MFMEFPTGSGAVSLKEVIRQNPSLFRHPIYWTEAHLETLHCRFVDCPQVHRAVTSSNSPTIPSPLEKQILTDLNALFPDEDLAVLCDPALHLLTRLFPFKPTETLKLHFGTHSYDLNGCQGFLSSICANSVVAKVPLAFVNLKHIDYRRANRLQVHRASCNEPVRALNKIHHKLPTPENADKDPYIIAVMIALAQQAEDQEMDVLVHVLTTSTQKNGDHKQDAFSI